MQSCQTSRRRRDRPSRRAASHSRTAEERVTSFEALSWSLPKVAIPAGTYVATMAIRLAYGRLLSPPGWSRLASLAVSNVDLYLELADRANTRRSYAASVRHFELEWRGALPATPDAIAQYLAHYAPSLTTSTLQVRLAGLSRWHRDHGFVDPTKAPLVQQVLKGVRAAHNAPRRQARPVEFDVLKRVSDWLDAEIAAAEASASPRADLLRRSRDQAMLRLGFWRGFRSDELCRLQYEHVRVDHGAGMTCFIPRTKSDRAVMGQTFECPALSRLCPVEAFLAWGSRRPARRRARCSGASTAGAASGTALWPKAALCPRCEPSSGTPVLRTRHCTPATRCAAASPTGRATAVGT